ncbi:DMT family transporter [Cupriavidus sp. WKF15]|uniref:DMT family transporter n=1 Tax=Cupriavidus sp. WKF15 TaxID=3032282 RepID=UPI0023E196E3|nr:DMT family transporter [Cupriavidus sp. WKF15]WER46193.1 DMT family transporter [Cupriavidus sp. WKF15]
MPGTTLPANLLLPLTTAMLAGAAIPFQAGANTTLGRGLGHPLWATVASLLVSLAAILPLLWFLKVPLPALPQAVRQPPWMWTGGVLGVFYITTALLMAPRLGAGGFIAAVVAGQVAAALLADHFGLAGFAVRALTPARLAGAALIVAGMVVMQWSSAHDARPHAAPPLQSGA